MDIISHRSEQLKGKLIEWRRHFHQYPELSFREEQTSRFIETTLKTMGAYDIKTGIAGHGIVAEATFGDGPVIGIRADMDALPIQEKGDGEPISAHPGVMHACGHDAHMAMLLGVAQLLAEDLEAGRINGTVKLIFQPAEESTDEYGLTGAPYVLQSGIVDDLDAILSLHICPWRKVGEIQVNKGPSMANIDNFTLKIKGTGGHGGYPYQTTDPIWIGSYILQGIYSLISRKLNPLEVGTISVGSIHGGNSANVIPDTVEIKGTIRSYTHEIRQQLRNELAAVAKIAESLGGEYDLSFEYGEPALNNDPLIMDLIIQSAKRMYPNMKIYEEPYGMGGEDFSHFTERIPGAMFFLGCAPHSRKEYHLHTPEFKLDEDALPIGTAILTKCVREFLEGKLKPGGDR
ncbi:amidohydrolase [Evansella vedderi]|uniref:Amidohydrolase n=1 Tax=Evansella vedderi TaxID=38282 RepID=A0ABT9ZXJ0_9BACI|nr:amidohydrolase [Evansella vedderi]MDQ0255961.1 amidohydrolase [Evansella vedderi]